MGPAKNGEKIQKIYIKQNSTDSQILFNFRQLLNTANSQFRSKLREYKIANTKLLFQFHSHNCLKKKVRS